MLTPDDPVSPFGSGTTPGASYEASQVKIYERFGRYIGDCVWLGWRNSGYGVSYYTKPDWLKREGLRYMDLVIDDRRTIFSDWEGRDGIIDRTPDGEPIKVGTLWVRTPEGSWLWETTRKWGPFYVITGYRLSAIASGAEEDRKRVARGQPPVPRPLYHPNMDGRPIVSMRTKRTM